MLKLLGGNLEKPVRLNAYKRIKKGTEFNVTVNGETVAAIMPKTGKYTYLTVGGVEYYVTAELAADAAYTSEDVQPAPKPEKVAKPPKEPKAAKEPRAAA